MPQVELKYSHNVQIDVDALFEAIEAEINDVDSSAGVCKSRGYPADKFLHTHVVLSVALLKKPHRDAAFMQQLLNRLKLKFEEFVPVECYYSIDLYFSGDYYLTF